MLQHFAYLISVNESHRKYVLQPHETLVVEFVPTSVPLLLQYRFVYA